MPGVSRISIAMYDAMEVQDNRLKELSAGLDRLTAAAGFRIRRLEEVVAAGQAREAMMFGNVMVRQT